MIENENIVIPYTAHVQKFADKSIVSQSVWVLFTYSNQGMVSRLQECIYIHWYVSGTGLFKSRFCLLSNDTSL